MSKREIITTQRLAGLEPGKSVADPAPRGAGRLVATRLPSETVVFYYRHTKPDGTRDRLSLGPYDPNGRTGLKLAVARAKAGELSRRYVGGDRNLRESLAVESGAKITAVTHAHQAQTATLGALLQAYVGSLAGRASQKSVAGSFKRNVENARPDLWARAVVAIGTDDLLDVLAALVHAGKLTSAARLRGHFQAAFASAIRARHDAKASKEMRAVRLSANVARELSTIEGASNARHRALNVSELRHYWRRICELKTHWGAILRVHLLTGGQRVQQLLRATADDLDLVEHTLALSDPKGRRTTPRRHVLPLLPEVEAAIESLTATLPDGTRGRTGPYLFSAAHGARPASFSGCSIALAKIAAGMAKAGELDGGLFTIGDLRRTVETRLAALGVARETRAQLQSHGLTGVQAKHYDRHDYMDEKRAALVQLHELLTGQSATVTNIKAKRAKVAK